MLIRWAIGKNLPLHVILGMAQQAAQAVGSNCFGSFFLGNPEKVRDSMIAAHHRASTALKSGRGKYPVGVTISMQAEQAIGPESKRDQNTSALSRPWLTAPPASDLTSFHTYPP